MVAIIAIGRLPSNSTIPFGERGYFTPFARERIVTIASTADSRRDRDSSRPVGEWSPSWPGCSALAHQREYDCLRGVRFGFGAPRRTRSLAATGLLLSSYLFGLTSWFMGLVLTWTLWGGGAVFVGLILMGVGVVPMGLLATLFRGDWGPFLLLLGAIIATFAVRAYSLYLAATSVSPFGEA